MALVPGTLEVKILDNFTVTIPLNLNRIFSPQIGAPMSANILEVRVAPGVKVAAGDPLCLLSAMKMETVVSSPLSGTVTSVEVSVGESIGAQDLMFVITPN